MPAGYFGAWFLRRLLEGRKASEVERGFWIFVAWIVGFLFAFLALAPLLGFEVVLFGFAVVVIATLAARAAWTRR